MAAATVASQLRELVGRRRKLLYVLTAPANDDTLDTGLKSIDSVQITWRSATVAAADAIGYTVSGGTITFKVVGTARDLDVVVIGR